MAEMNILKQDDFLAIGQIAEIVSAITIVDALVATTPDKVDFGEFIIAYKLVDEMGYRTALHATLPNGINQFCCAEAKIQTLINHPEVCLTGALKGQQLAEGEVSWYGGRRISLEHYAENDADWDAEYDVLIAFSGRKEFWDEFYVEAIIASLQATEFGSITTSELVGDELDPVVVTVKSMYGAMFGRVAL